MPHKYNPLKDILTYPLKYLREDTTDKSCKTRLQYINYCGMGLIRGGIDNEYLYTHRPDTCGLRIVGFSDEINQHICHKGWFIDSDQIAGTCRGVVYRLPARKGKNLFLAGHYQDYSDQLVLFVGQSYEDASDAAKKGDRQAEKYAEKSREFYAKDQAEQQILFLREEIHECGKNILELIKEFKKVTREVKLNLTVYPVLKDAICFKLSSLLRDRRQAFKRIAALQDNYWLSVGE